MRSEKLGSGTIGGYGINSACRGRTFLDCLLADEQTELTRLNNHKLTRMLAAVDHGTVASRDVSQFLGMVGDAMQRIVAQHPASSALTGYHVIDATRVADS